MALNGISGPDHLKHVLMVAYHFPPLAGSSGIQRTLRFVQHLPQFGWQPVVLTVHPRAYPETRADLLDEIPEETTVHRSFALDTARHLSLGRRYLASLARPDRWISWRLAGVRDGIELVRRFDVQALWSTYPIATAHVIGAELQRHTGLPWIADFRDPMAQPDYPPDPITWKHYQAIEQRALRQARASMFTTPSAARTYAQRYPDVAERIVVLENGYDEESFAPMGDERPPPLVPRAFTLLHSGIVYPSERDPSQLLQALRVLADGGEIEPEHFRVRFRAPVHEELLKRMARDQGVQEFVEVMPPVGYRDALQEMVRADALLVMQAANCNEQVPAKVYEYLRAGRPIVCLSDPAGDTAAILRHAGVQSCACLDRVDEIVALLRDLLNARCGSYLPAAPAVASASRVQRAKVLAEHLDRSAAR